MKYLKMFEQYINDEYVYVGIHCSNYEIDDFRGEITEEYYIRFVDILHLIKDDYPEANEYIERFDNLDYDDEDLYEEEMMELSFDIEYFLKSNNLECIYVSTNDPLYKYGDNCYDVYFDNKYDLYSMDDDLVKDAKLYIYKSTTNKPKLIPI